MRYCGWLLLLAVLLLAVLLLDALLLDALLFGRLATSVAAVLIGAVRLLSNSFSTWSLNDGNIVADTSLTVARNKAGTARPASESLPFAALNTMRESTNS